MMFDDDLALQLQLQDINRRPSIMDLPDNATTFQWKSRKGSENEDPNRKQTSLIDPSFEYIDPTPDVHAMFLQFNARFFWGKLYSVEVRWSPRMTSCAGVCCYEGRGGLCSIRLSAPLLKLRPRKDLVETLLHEMIHAFLFVTNNDRDRDGHGPEFHKHMYRINKEAGTKISVYHNFHDEVKLYQQHWWRCNGPCQKWRPYFGMVKRAMNRPPGPTDFWWANHQAKCGGTYIKVREPEGFSKKKTGQAPVKGNSTSSERNDIRNFFPFMGEGKTLATSNSHDKATGILNGKYSSEKGAVGKTDVNTSNKRKPSGVVNQGPVAVSSVVKGAPVSKDKSVGVKGLFDKSISNNHSNNITNSQKNVINNNKSNLPVGSFPNNNFGKPYRGGMLANKGSGTMVITQKGNKQTQKKNTSANDPVPHCSASAAVVPFIGKGYTIGSSSSSQPVLAATEKPWLSLLDKIEADRKKKKSLSSLTIPKVSSITKVVKTNNEVTQKESKMETRDELMQSPPKKFKTDPRTEPFFRKTTDIGSHNKIKSSSVSNDDAQSSANDSFEVMVNCPTCGMLVEEHAINSHLDICLQHDIKEGPISQNVANCPICSKGFPLHEIDSHIDVCLSNNDDSTSVAPEKEGEIIKCPMCDKKLLKCELDVHLESCILCITKEDACFIEEDCDSEVNDTNGSDCGEDLHPCPLCMKLVKENLMNNHLDDCLSADILKEITQE